MTRRTTADRVHPSLLAQAALIPRNRRADWLMERGWTRAHGRGWTHPLRPKFEYSEVAAVAHQLSTREDSTR